MNATTFGRGGRPGLARAPPATCSTPRTDDDSDIPAHRAGPDKDIDMPKKTQSSSGKALTTTRSTALQPARDTLRQMGGRELVRVDAVFHVPAVHPSGAGPWKNEADKIAWIDDMSGYGCIIRRSPTKRHLCGYVSVPPGHPLFGRHIGTMGDFLIGVHGGLDYAAACQARQAEEVSICHPSDNRTRRIVPEGFQQNVHVNEVAAGQIGDRHDDAWWFGFSCDQVTDITPTTREESRPNGLLDGVNRPTYKDEAFVYAQCVRLAAQLKAIEEGRDPRDADPGPRSVVYAPHRTEG